jgi:hypothetical protein
MRRGPRHIGMRLPMRNGAAPDHSRASRRHPAHLHRGSIRAERRSIRVERSPIRMERRCICMEGSPIRMERCCIRREGRSVRIDRPAIRLHRRSLHPHRTPVRIERSPIHGHWPAIGVRRRAISVDRSRSRSLALVAWPPIQVRNAVPVRAMDGALLIDTRRATDFRRKRRSRRRIAGRHWIVSPWMGDI